MNNEELQSRREFFKSAAKAALPVVAAALLANVAAVTNATESKSCNGCGYNCQGTCTGGCARTCHYTCQGTCKGACSVHCTHGGNWR